MIYTNYTNRLKNIVAENQQRKLISKGVSNFSGISGINERSLKDLIHEQRAFGNKLQLNAQPLTSILTPTVLTNAKVGLHPDFLFLKGTDETAYHYIVSVFIDIQGSTNLHREYELDEIYSITNTVQSAAIHTCLALGGHIQRLQGDGVFAYFGGKATDKKRAVEQALIATSLFTYFVENDLKNIFIGDEIEGIKTRIGIDYGDDKDVLWANFGLSEVSELTTLSLHTSLASKMQGFAKSNGIVVGQNVKDKINVGDSLFDFVKNSKGEIVKRYIFEDDKKNFRYTQYNFNWYSYLKSLPFIKSDTDGNLFINNPNSEEERLAKLRATSTIISAGNAYLDKQGNISNQSTGTHHQPHRFHYGK